MGHVRLAMVTNLGCFLRNVRGPPNWMWCMKMMSGVVRNGLPSQIVEESACELFYTDGKCIYDLTSFVKPSIWTDQATHTIS